MELEAGHEFQLYVTHVDSEGPYIKITGQANKEGSIRIETIIRNLRDNLDLGLTGLITPASLHVGFLCIAKYKDGSYYRATITSIENIHRGYVFVNFIDFGNNENISVNAIRHIGNFPEHLRSMPPQAVDFILSCIMHEKGAWEDARIHELRKLIQYQEISCKIDEQVCDRLFATMTFQGHDLSTYLVLQHFGKEVPIAKQIFLMKKMIDETTKQWAIGKTFTASNKQALTPSVVRAATVAGYQKPFHIATSKFVSPDQTAYPQEAQTSKTKIARNMVAPRPLNKAGSSRSPDIYHPPHSPYRDVSARSSMSPAKTIRSNPSTYKSRLLELNSEHKVRVSYAKDGPELFAIQLLNDEDCLISIVGEINSLPPRKLAEPPIIGSVCLGRFSEDNALCRAVVMGLTGNQCKLFFVDFGMTELVSYYDIFHIPEEFVTPSVFSLRFCLSGIKDLIITEEVKNEFYKIVHNKVLVLKVVSPEGPPLIQYGELYLNELSVKEMLVNMQEAKLFSFKRIQSSSVLGEHSILVSFVDSCTKFFVQLSENIDELNVVMEKVNIHCKAAKPLLFHEVKSGMPCCALFPDDHNWYRAQVTNIRKDKITVNYVDYGNEQEVTADFLRPINTNLMNLKGQAIHCALKGYESKPFDQEISDNLETLTLEKTLKMSAHKILPGGVLLVELVDETCSPPMDIAKHVGEYSRLQAEKNVPENPKSSPRRKQKGLVSTDSSNAISPDEKMSYEPRNSHDKKYSDKKNYDAGDNYGNRNTDRQYEPDNQDVRRSNYSLTKIETESYNSNKFERKPFNGQGASKAPQQNYDNPRRKKQSENLYIPPNSHFANPRRYDNKPDTRKSSPDRFTSVVKQYHRQDRYKTKDTDSYKKNADDKPKYDSYKRYEDDRPNYDDKPKSYGNRYGGGDNDYKKTPPKAPVVSEKFLKSPASVSTPFGDCVLDVGCVLQAKVTWFVNPNEFYIQILTRQTEFESMMMSIPSLYTGVKNMSDNISPGASVLARFPEDKVLYRAQIVEVTTNGTFVVQFVDFGNKCIVKKTDLWQLEEELMSLPRLAMKCSLNGVTPIENAWKTNTSIDDCFNAPMFMCTLHSTDANNTHLVSLARQDGTDVGQQLVEKNLARAVTMECETETDEPVDIDYLIGQEIHVRICHVDTVDKFFLHIDPIKADSVLSSIKTYKNLQPLSADLVVDGTHCTCEDSEGNVIRAIITDSSNKDEVCIVCPDFGYEQKIAPDKLKTLPSELAVCFYLSYVSKLHNYEEGTSKRLLTDEEFVKKLSGNNFIAYIDNVIEGVLYVTLYDPLTGKKMEFFTPDNGAFDSVMMISPHPVYQRNFGSALVCHLESFDSVFIQKVKSVETISNLLSSICEYYEDEAHQQPLSVMKIDMFCAVKSEDGNWYRAKIQEVLTDRCEVQYIDYGNTEVISMKDICTLDANFYLPHQLCLCVTLDAVPFSCDALPTLKDAIIEKCVDVVLDVGRAGWVSHIAVDNADIVETLVKKGLVQIDNGVQNVVEALLPVEDTAGESLAVTTSVLVSHIDSPGQFWLQHYSDVSNVTELQEKIQSAKSFDDLLDYEVGQLCVAMYSANEQYYRAVILDADNEITTVRFTDYGNTDVLDSTPGVLKCLPTEWREIPPYAMKCSVNATPSGTGQWTEQASDLFIKLLGNMDDPVDAVFILKDTTNYVDLYVNEENITKKLVDAGFAKAAEQSDGGEMATCFASHVNSPSEFWIQLESSIPELETVSESLIDANDLPPLGEIEEEVVCAAQFPEDGSWYRAQVIIHGTEGTEVLFMDYGNASLTNELRSLPDSLKIMPALSRKCALQKPTNVKNWSKEAEMKFAELAADGATVFHVSFIASGDISIVELFVDGKSVTEDLLALCETHTIMNSDKQPPAHEDKMLSVHCSHCNCPEDFWVQSNNSDEIDMITQTLLEADKLEPLANIEEGELCTSLFPEDGLWYRSKILDHGEAGTEVLHIDYGTKAISTDLRAVPSILNDIPALAKHCSLLLPPNKTKWSVKFHEKFAELMLRSKILHIEEVDSDVDPVIVKLFENGENIINQLDELHEGVSLQPEESESVVEVKPSFQSVQPDESKLFTEVEEDFQSLNINVVKSELKEELEIDVNIVTGDLEDKDINVISSEETIDVEDIEMPAEAEINVSKNIDECTTDPSEQNVDFDKTKCKNHPEDRELSTIPIKDSEENVNEQENIIRASETVKSEDSCDDSTLDNTLSADSSVESVASEKLDEDLSDNSNKLNSEVEDKQVSPVDKEGADQTKEALQKVDTN